MQYRPTRGDVRNLVGNGIFEADVNVYSIKVKEIERKKLFSLKTKDRKFISRAKGWRKALPISNRRVEVVEDETIDGNTVGGLTLCERKFYKWCTEDENGEFVPNGGDCVCGATRLPEPSPFPPIFPKSESDKWHPIRVPDDKDLN